MTNAKTLPKLVGERVRRREDPRLITGLGIYVDDIKLPGMLHMNIVRSTHAHARLRNVDTSAAKAADGVELVMTGTELTSACRCPSAIKKLPTPHSAMRT